MVRAGWSELAGGDAAGRGTWVVSVRRQKPLARHARVSDGGSAATAPVRIVAAHLLGRMSLATPTSASTAVMVDQRLGRLPRHDPGSASNGSTTTRALGSSPLSAADLNTVDMSVVT